MVRAAKSGLCELSSSPLQSEGPVSGGSMLDTDVLEGKGVRAAPVPSCPGSQGSLGSLTCSLT